MTERRKRLVAVIVGVLAIVYFLYFILKFSIFVIDDAYIHLRIARNIALFGKPFFNLDEKVMGSTPHLWINLIALIFRISGITPSFVPYLSWIFTVGAFLCLVNLLASRFKPIRAELFAFLITAVFLLPSSAGLMETPMAIFIILLAACFFRKGQAAWAGFFAGLSILVRLEFCVFVFVGFFLMDSRMRRSYLMALALPISVYIIYTISYFGTVVPLPVIAKPRVFSIGWIEFFMELPTASSYPERFRQICPPTVKAVIVGSSLLVSLIILIDQERKARPEPWIRWLLYSSVLVLTAYFFRKVYVFTWYAPIFSVALVLSCVLILKRRTWWLVGPFLALGCFNMLFIGGKDTFAAVTGRMYDYDEYASGWRVRQYLKIGAELYKKNPKAVLMTSEIGALGWAFEGEVKDGAALISPEALKYHPMPVPRDRPWHMAGAIPAHFVEDVHPDFIVSMPIYSVAVRREINAGTLKYVVMQSYPILPPEESRLSGITTLWSSDRIDVLTRE